MDKIHPLYSVRWYYFSIQTSTAQLWSLGMNKQLHPTLCWACYYLSMLWLKLNHVSKRGPWFGCAMLCCGYFMVGVMCLFSCFLKSWWRHQMETFSTLLALCAGYSMVTGEFPSQRPVTRSFDVFFDLCLNKRLSKQFKRWWFETPSSLLWRHRNVNSAR